MSLAYLRKESKTLVDWFNVNSDSSFDMKVIDSVPYYNVREYLPFTLRNYQKNIFKKVFYENIRKMFLHWPRRAGKDTTFMSIVATMAHMKRGQYAYLLPYNVQAKRIIWNGGVNTKNGVHLFKEFFNKKDISSINSHEMTITLKNGSVFYLAGTDNYERLRGIFLNMCVLSEYAFGKPGVMDVLSPVFEQAQTTVLINTTPYGFNFSWDAFKKYQVTDGWYCELETCESLLDDNGNRYITEEMVQGSRDNGMSEGMIRQEYYCEPFLDSNLLYFAQEINTAQIESRWKCKDLVIKGRQLHFGLDLGLNDPTVIIGFQIADDRSIHVVYYYENINQNWLFYADVIKWLHTEMGCTQGIAFLPHDGAKRSPGADAYGDGQFVTAEKDFNKRGIRTLVVPRIPFKDDAISTAKNYLNLTKFDENRKIDRLRDGLQSYTKDIIKSTKEPGNKPKHDWASHIADAYMTVATAYEKGIRPI